MKNAIMQVRFVKWVRFFERNCIVKGVIFFYSFCWLSDFFPKYKVFNDLFSGPNFIFLDCLGHFSKCNFKTFRLWPTMVAGIFTQPSPGPLMPITTCMNLKSQDSQIKNPITRTSRKLGLQIIYIFAYIYHAMPLVFQNSILYKGPFNYYVRTQGGRGVPQNANKSERGVLA